MTSTLFSSPNWHTLKAEKKVEFVGDWQGTKCFTKCSSLTTPTRQHWQRNEKKRSHRTDSPLPVRLFPLFFLPPQPPAPSQHKQWKRMATLINIPLRITNLQTCSVMNETRWDEYALSASQLLKLYTQQHKNTIFFLCLKKKQWNFKHIKDAKWKS